MYKIERCVLSNRNQFVAGVDEAGRGPLAGPVVAAAVVLNPDDPIEGLADSKKLTAKRRELMLAELEKHSLSIAVAAVGAREIERVNILQASLRAMAIAVRRLTPPLGYILVDGNRKIPVDISQLTVISGDSKCACIAAASIVAKVVRDRLMVRFDRRFPVYGFAKHKGYPTQAHQKAIRKNGPCFLHRRTFRGVTWTNRAWD